MSGHTPQNGEQVAEAIGPTLAMFVQKAEPSIRKASEELYEQLLYSVQDYLRENAEWNLGAEIDRCRAIERDNVQLMLRNEELIDLAYQYLSDLRHPPHGDSLQRRIERAEAVLAKAKGTTP